MIESLPSLLFSFKGRIDRATFAFIFFAQLGVALFLWLSGLKIALFGFLAGMPDDTPLFGWSAVVTANGASPALRVASAILTVLLCWISCANQTKRLHDLGWSGWVQVALYGGVLIVWLAGLGFDQRLPPALGFVTLVVSYALAAFIRPASFLLFYGALFFRKGTQGANRFDALSGKSRKPQSLRPESAMTHAS